MLVGVFEAHVKNRGRLAPVQAFFQLLFSDALNGHGAIFPVPWGIVKLWGPDWRIARYGVRMTCCRTGAAAGINACLSRTAQPFDLFPQWMQRRKTEPEQQVIPKS